MRRNILFFYIRTFINSIIIKRKKLLFFYDQGLISFNEIALIKYLVRKNSKYKIIFYTNRKEEAKRILPNGVRIISGKMGWIYQFSSKYVFVEQNNHKWICRKNKYQVVVQLWHGLPVKSAGYANNASMFMQYKDFYTYVLAPSEYGWSIMKECFGYEDCQKLIFGSPRNDEMFVNKDIEQQIYQLYSDRYFLWMPTFRKNYYSNSREISSFPLVDEQKVFCLDQLLKNRNIKIVVKLHSLNEKYIWFSNKYENICFVTNDDLYSNGISTYNLLGKASALITDYSSVAIDFMCLNKPIIYTIDDIEDFSEKRGLLRTYDLVKQTGQMVDNINSLVYCIDQILVGVDDYYDKRLEISKFINTYNDDKNCERLCECILHE